MRPVSESSILLVFHCHEIMNLAFHDEWEDDGQKGLATANATVEGSRKPLGRLRKATILLKAKETIGRPTSGFSFSFFFFWVGVGGLNPRPYPSRERFPIFMALLTYELVLYVIFLDQRNFLRFNARRGRFPRYDGPNPYLPCERTETAVRKAQA